MSETAATARTGSQRFRRDGLLAAVFLAGLLGGFALVFLAPASLRQQIAGLIAPGSDTIPSTGPVAAPIVGDAIVSGLSIDGAPTLPMFPVRPVVAGAGGEAPSRSAATAPETDAAPLSLAASAPGIISVTFSRPGLGPAEAGRVAPVIRQLDSPPLQVRVPATFANASLDIGAEKKPDMALPALPQIGTAPELLGDRATALPPRSLPIALESLGFSAPMPLEGLPADASLASAAPGLTPPHPILVPGDLRLAGGSTLREPARLAPGPSWLRLPQELPAASPPDVSPDPTSETAALAEATRSAARLLEENRPVAVSAMRGLPAFKDAGHLSPAPGQPGPGGSFEDGKASVFVDVGQQPGIVMATYWPSGELIAAAPVRKARRPAAIRQAPATNAPSAADQAVAKQVTRIILQRRVERMLRELR